MIKQFVTKHRGALIFSAVILVLLLLIISGEVVRAGKHRKVLVETEGKWGYAGSSGEILIEPQFDEAREFHGDYAVVKNAGFYGAINDKGKVIIEPEYQALRDYKNGYFAARQDDLWGFLDKNGNPVTPFQYESTQDMWLNKTTRAVLDGKSMFISSYGEEIGLWKALRFPLAELIELSIDWGTDRLSGFTRSVSAFIEGGIEAIEKTLLFIPAIILIIGVGLITWFFVDRKVAVFSVVGLIFIENLGLWEPTISTLSLVLLSTFIAMLYGLPLGILGALSKSVYNFITPILDFMQTMPAFVYLIPAIPFFGLGAVSAIFATVIFAIPPVIRLTALGIRQINAELIEAADAFGSTKWQKLFKVQIPLAMPTIMAGINQTIMLALSMVVIAAMIGAGGLGGEVWRAIQRLWMGRGFEAGIAVVIIAMVLDRITQKIAGNNKSK